MIGQQLGQYRILDRLGEGGMGAVYRATDELLEREVALKMLRPELAHRQDIVDRFKTEAMTLAKLDHRAIARLHGLTREAGHLFMVMEFVPGDTLQASIERAGAMPWRRAASILDELLAGLDYAHQSGVIHRDIKPANVIVRPDGRVKVTDFGIARVLGTSRATRAGHIVGTIEYMAPEQIRGEEVDARTDLYAAAIVFFELLTGRVPFSATTEFDLMKMQLEAPVPSVYPLAGRAPAWCDELIGRAMAKNPADRFASAEEFRSALAERVAAEGPESAQPKPTRLASAPARPTRVAGPAPSSRDVAPRPSPAPFSKRVLAGAAVLVVLAAAAAPFAWRKAFPPAKTPVPVATPATVQQTLGGGALLPVEPPPVAEAPKARTPRTRAVAPPPVVTEITTPKPPVSKAAADPAPLEFNKVSLLVLDGNKTREREAIIRFEATGLVVRDAKYGDVLRRLSYASIESATYSQSKQPRWKTAGAATVLGGVFAAPMFFLKSTKHWLTIEGSSAVLVLRLDKNNHQLVLPELQARSGVTVAK